MMEKIEARTRAYKKAREVFYEPDVQYERLTPILKQYLATTGERLVNMTSRCMAEEAKRQAILASMPRTAPGYDAAARDFELERIRERKDIERVLNDRDQKIAKATRFQKHIPPPAVADNWDDNEEWVNAVMEQAAALGIDTKHELDYELLPLGAESLEHPLPPGWTVSKGGFKHELINGASSVASGSSKSTAMSEEVKAKQKKALVVYSNEATGATM